jgi:hypothetical protein
MLIAAGLRLGAQVLPASQKSTGHSYAWNDPSARSSIQKFFWVKAWPFVQLEPTPVQVWQPCAFRLKKRPVSQVSQRERPLCALGCDDGGHRLQFAAPVESLYSFAGQSMQVTLPWRGAKRPARQTSQAEAPMLELNCPGGHGKQLFMLVLGAYVPSPQFRHKTPADSFWNLPRGHSMQLSEFSSVLNLPASHSSHTDAPSEANLPAGQEVHEVALPSGAAEPREQLWHVLLPN